MKTSKAARAHLMRDLGIIEWDTFLCLSAVGSAVWHRFLPVTHMNHICNPRITTCKQIVIPSCSSYAQKHDLENKGKGELFKKQANCAWEESERMVAVSRWPTTTLLLFIYFFWPFCQFYRCKCNLKFQKEKIAWSQITWYFRLDNDSAITFLTAHHKYCSKYPASWQCQNGSITSKWTAELVGRSTRAGHFGLISVRPNFMVGEHINHQSPSRAFGFEYSCIREKY